MAIFNSHVSHCQRVPLSNRKPHVVFLRFQRRCTGSPFGLWQAANFLRGFAGDEMLQEATLALKEPWKQLSDPIKDS